MPLVVNHLSHIYMPGSPFEQVALDDVSLTVEDGDFAAIIGHTGSGKSTLVQHFCGLLKPTRGEILVDGVDVARKDADVRAVRRKIGLVFQYPEYQLFEETVRKDIAFGPKNMGLDQQEIDRRVQDACRMVKIDYEELGERSPFELSGGQKRRVAIAGVLAMEPSILILDEPTAGLDPRGRDEILELVKSWHGMGRTIIMVSHSMDDVARLAQKVFVFERGRLVMQGPPEQVFEQGEALQRIGLDLPAVAHMANALRGCGVEVPQGNFGLDAIEQAVLARFGKEENQG